MSRYISKYTDPNRPLSAPQKIVELICEKLAQKNGQQLTFRFWENKEWKKFFIYQIIIANRLLKKYPPQVIIKTLRNPKLKKLYSLGAKFLIPFLEEELKLFNRQVYNEETEIQELNIQSRNTFQIYNLPKDL